MNTATTSVRQNYKPDEQAKPIIQGVFERTEQKYMLDSETYFALMRGIGNRLEYDEFGRNMISSLYYDTPDDDMVNRTLEKPLYREKLRIRAYGEPKAGDALFVELKKKFKGIVYKRRVPMTAAAAEAYMQGMPYGDATMRFPLADERLRREGTGGKALQIAREIDVCKSRYPGLHPSMMIIVKRLALHGKEDDVRITFDIDPLWREDRLSFGAGFEGRRLLPEGMIIMETKCLKTYPLWLSRALCSLHAYPVACSKYGTAYMESRIGSTSQYRIIPGCRISHPKPSRETRFDPYTSLDCAAVEPMKGKACVR
jgi:hypothetical protein